MDTRKKVGLFTAMAGAALVVSSMMPGTANADGVTDGQTISSHNTNGELPPIEKCDDTEWHWNITGLSGEGVDSSDLPQFITVVWDKAPSPTQIALSNFTGGVAHYSYTGHLDDDAVPQSASATFPDPTDVDSYNQFNLSHGGPCAPEETVPDTENTLVINTLGGPPDTTPETTQVGSEGPTTTVTGSSGGELPATGSTQGLALTVGLVLLGLGAVLATLTRRSAAS